MKMETVFAKTAKGVEEMTRRTYRLPARMRGLLIMMDGRTPAFELLSRAVNAEEAREFVTTLVTEGFIEAVAPSAIAGPALTDSPPHSAPLTHAKQALSRFLISVMGPDADYFTGAIDKAQTSGELRTIVQKYADAVRAAAGGKKAEEFRAMGEALG